MVHSRDEAPTEQKIRIFAMREKTNVKQCKCEEKENTRMNGHGRSGRPAPHGNKKGCKQIQWMRASNLPNQAKS